MNDLPKTESITIQSVANTFNENRDQVFVWSDVATNVEANVEIRDVKEEYQWERLNVDRLYHIVMPYRSGMDEAMRIVYKGKNLNIHSITDDELTNRYMIIQAYADKDTYDNAFPTTTTTTTTTT
jgi:SPP1 family predicted phage head-tail adaptor